MILVHSPVAEAMWNGTGSMKTTETSAKNTFSLHDCNEVIVCTSSCNHTAWMLDYFSMHALLLWPAKFKVTGHAEGILVFLDPSSSLHVALLNHCH